MSNRGATSFDRLIRASCQKGVTASKSAGMVGKWGSTTYTSLRAAKNGGDAGGGAAKPKKFFKSRQAKEEEVFEAISDVAPIVPTVVAASAAGTVQKRPADRPTAAVAAPAAPPKRNKFFTSKKPRPGPGPAEDEGSSSSSTPEPPMPAAAAEASSPPATMKVPPLKLRIKTAPFPPAAVKPPPSEMPQSRFKVAKSDSSEATSTEEEEDEEEEEEEDKPTVTPSQNPSSSSTLAHSQGVDSAASKSEDDDEEENQPLNVAPAAKRTYARSGAKAATAGRTEPKSYSRTRRTRNNSRTESVPAAAAEEVAPSKAASAAAPVRPQPPPPAPVPDLPSVKEEEDDDDHEISFKDDSLVIKSPNSSADVLPLVEGLLGSTTSSSSKAPPAPATQEKPAANLKKAATVASSSHLERELLVADPSPAPAETSSSSPQPLEADLPPPAAPADGPPRPKRSIFKSKASKNNGEKPAKKGLSLYKHKWNAGPVDSEEDFRKEVISRAVFRGLADDGGGMDFPDDGPAPIAAFRRGQSQPATAADLPPTDMSFADSKLTRLTSTGAPGSTSSSAAVGAGPSSSGSPFDETLNEVVSVKCPREQRDYYMVIKNVKKAHQIQDSGEFQEFNDDVEYILDGLGKSNSLSTRCLSTVTLASKCMEPGFRMHLRAHGTVTKFFAELRDAPANASLALCASTVLFVLSQDRLNMDLDRDSLELMLNLLDTDSKLKDALDGAGLNRRELEKNKQKVQDLVAAMAKRGHANTQLAPDQISADHLSMETLLSLTSKRAGEWFKEELRDLGGLDHLVRTMSDCVAFLEADEISVWTDPLHDKLRKAGRVLKVLENVTHENEENCVYLLKYSGGKFLQLVHKMFKLLDEEVPLNPSQVLSDKDSVSSSLRDTLFDVIRVYINLVHDYHYTPFGSEMAGKYPDLFDLTLHCLFVLPESIPPEKRFDVLVLALTLLINLVENCKPNRALLMKCRVPDSADSFTRPSERPPAFEGLVRLFLDKEQSARVEETKTDNILDGVKDEEEEEQKKLVPVKERDEKSQEERIEETVAKLLHKAGRHMEDTLIGSYVVLIIGYLIYEDKDHEASVRALLPDGDFGIMVAVLKKFFNFMNLTASATLTSNRGLKATESIIKYLEKIDKPEEDEEKAGVKEESFDDLTLFDVSKDEDTTNVDDSSTSAAPAYGFPGEDDEFGKL